MNTVGVTILTIGATQIIMDLLVRQSLVREMLTAVGIRDRVSAVGITDVQGGEKFDWEGLIERSREVSIYVSSSQPFLQQVWPHILRMATRSEIAVTVISPSDDSPRSRLTSAMERDWKARYASLKKGSRIALYETRVSCRYGYLKTDERLAIVIDPLNDDGGFNSSVVHAYSIGVESEARTMFCEPITVFQNQVLREAGPLFADVAGRSKPAIDAAPSGVGDPHSEIESLNVPMDKKGE